MTRYVNELISIVTGLLVTTITSIIPVKTLIGGTHYGIPFPWLIKLVLAPEYSPWRINYLNFGIDILIWTVLVELVVIYINKQPKKE